MSAPGPIRVALIDIAEPIVELDCRRDYDPPYVAAWILVYSHGRPVGSVELALDGTHISARRLERELRTRFADAWSREPEICTVPLPRASVVVPTAMSRPEELRRCVRSLADLDYPDYEVIVVDNRAAGTAPVDLPGVRVVRETRPGTSAARNKGLAEATGEIVAFTDDDVEVDRRWLRALGERFAQAPKPAAVTGLVVPAELETPAQIFFEQSGSGPDRGYDALTFEREGRFQIKRSNLKDGGELVHSLYQTGELGLGSNMAFRASVLRAAGGFDEALGPGTPAVAGEDLEVLVGLLATGERLAYEPGAVVHHTHRATMAELERQLHGYGVGFTAMLTAIALRHPRHFVGLAAVVPSWLRSLRNPESVKRANRGVDFPVELGTTELRGMLAGPVAYLRARRRWAS
jgi:cellulose synthase/poly-beta-1,6-N-acetylglucosamine synthase-like glycosyltransferase